MAYNPYIKQGNSLQGGGIGSLQGNVSPLQGGYSPQVAASPTPQPSTNVKPSSPSATTSVAQKAYTNDLSSRYGQSGSQITRKSDNYNFTSPEEFYKDAGVNSFNGLKFDTAYKSPAAQTFIGNQLQTSQPAGTGVSTMPPTAPVSAPKSAYLEYLKKQFDPVALETASGNVNELNKRTSEELLRARTREDEVRGNKIGQIESGLNHDLSENSRLSNKSLADLALSKGYASDEYNRLLGLGKDLYNTETAEQKIADSTLGTTAPALLAEFENLKSKPEQDAYVRSKATELGVSIDKVNAALQSAIQAKKNNTITLSEGEAVYDPATGQFVVKNPKTYDPNSGSGGGGVNGLGLTNQQLDNISPLTTQFKGEPIVQNFNTIAEGYNFARSLADDTKNPADDQALIYALAKALDPGSVVREGEYATAQKYAQSLAQSYGKSITQALSGTGFLSADARKNIKQTIESRYNTSLTNYNNVVSEYGRKINLVGGITNGDQFLTNYAGGYNSTGGGGNPDDIINKYLGFSSAGNASASTPYLSTLGAITAETGGSPLWKWGLDIDLKIGDPVRAPVGGVVIAAAPNGGFGNQVKVRAADGTEYWFSHLSKGSVKVGQTIPKGSVIGLGGNTGNTIPGKGGDGSHLDLTAKDKNGNYIKPEVIAQLLRQTYV